MPAYDAFISYSHAKDMPIARALQSVVQTLGKPWYKLRELRVFRDDTSIAATPRLWGSIETALGDTRYLILLASPESAKSTWVNKEVAYWLEHKSVNTLLIALTNGSLSWDGAANDFAWTDATPLPPALKGRFPEVPLWVDLTAFRETAQRSDNRLAELAASFAAAVRGVAKEDLLSEEVRQKRRALRLAWSAAATMFVLAVGVAWYWHEAATQRDKAESTLAATTESVNGLVIEVAAKIRRTIGIPVALTEDILARTRRLQERLIDSWESDPRLGRSQAIVHREIAQTYGFLGNSQAALDNALKSRAIMDQLLAEDKRNRDLLRELSRSHNRVGEAYTQKGDHSSAYASFQQGLEIRKALVVPGVDETERELALSYERTGDALFNLKKFANAREMYDENLKLRKKLALAQPLNNEWQGELAVAYDRIGARVECQTNPAAALHAIRQALEIRKKLVIKEPQDAIWQQGLAASYNYDGSFLLAAGKNGEAAAAFRKSLAIREALAAGNPDNAQWQANLIITLVKLAEAGDDAKQRYIRARAIASDLQQKGKLTASQQDWPDMIEQQLADLETNPVAAAPMPCEGA